jgi:CHAT domain-containing protein/tetratricopeptide (TPR) repeat protein
VRFPVFFENWRRYPAPANQALHSIGGCKMSCPPAIRALALAAFVGLSLAPASRAQEARTLEPGQPIGRELAGGQTHVYRVALAAGQYLHLVVEQRGIEVVVVATGVDGARILEVDSPRGALGPKSVLLIAEAGGSYRFEVSARDKEALDGRYEIKIGELRAATAADRDRVAAERAQLAGDQLLALATGEARQRSVGQFQEALRLSRSLNDRQREAVALYSLGRASHELGDGAAALGYYTQSLALFQTPGSGGWDGVFGNLNLFYALMGGKQKGLDYLAEALPLVRALRNHRIEAILLTAIARIHEDMNQQPQALERYQQALALFRVVGNRSGEIINLTEIGDADLSSAEKQKARGYLLQALALARAFGDRALEATMLAGIGYLHHSLDEEQQGLDYDQQALAAYRALGDRNGEAYMLNFIGGFYHNAGDHQTAQDYFERALALFRQVQDRGAEAYALAALGAMYSRSGDWRKALDHFAQTLSTFRANGDRYGEAQALNNLGWAQWRLNEKSKALEFETQSLRVWRALGHRTGEAWTLADLGFIYAAAGESQKAREHFQQALELFRETGNRRGEAQALYGLASVESAAGQLHEARVRIEAALEIVEAQRAKLQGREFRASFVASQQYYYQFHREVLMQLHQREPARRFNIAALQANERARARSLLETLAEARADIRQGVDPALLERERDLQQQLNAKERARMQLLNRKHTLAQAAAAEKELRELTAQYQELQAQIRVSSPRYAALTQPQPLKLAEIQQQVIEADTLLLEYALGEERSYLWAVSREAVRSFELPKRAEVEAVARRFYDALVAFNQPSRAANTNAAQAATATRDMTEAGAALSRMLLAPVAAQLGTKRLLVVADGALQYVPFAALSKPAADGQVATDAQPLIVEHEIISLPSASSLAVLRRELAGRKAAAKTLALFADPVFAANDPRLQRAQSVEQPTSAAVTRELDRPLTRSVKEAGLAETGLRIPRLPGTRREAAAIVALVPEAERKQALDFDASRAAVLSAELGQHRIIHFATHGLLNSLHPELSGIVLSLVDAQGKPQEGFLRLHEIYNLRLPVELVVLSACQTGLGKEIKGEGLIGLTRGFMYAGAARVLASLWKVDDRATAELMQHFYQGMVKDGLPPAAALRAAQVALWKQPRWQAPYYWAAFVLQGEWK